MSMGRRALRRISRREERCGRCFEGRESEWMRKQTATVRCSCNQDELTQSTASAIIHGTRKAPHDGSGVDTLSCTIACPPAPSPIHGTGCRSCSGHWRPAKAADSSSMVVRLTAPATATETSAAVAAPFSWAVERRCSERPRPCASHIGRGHSAYVGVSTCDLSDSLRIRAATISDEPQRSTRSDGPRAVQRRGRRSGRSLVQAGLMSAPLHQSPLCSSYTRIMSAPNVGSVGRACSWGQRRMIDGDATSGRSDERKDDGQRLRMRSSWQMQCTAATLTSARSAIVTVVDDRWRRSIATSIQREQQSCSFHVLLHRAHMSAELQSCSHL